MRTSIKLSLLASTLAALASGANAAAATTALQCGRLVDVRALEMQAERTIVVDGNNADDRGDYRPGRQAAREFGVRSPLDDAGLTKAEIRALSHDMGLPTWDEPASACLSSRIPYQNEVTSEKLRMKKYDPKVRQHVEFVEEKLR